MSVTLAHAGHWLAQVAYAVPLVLVVVALVVAKVRERRAGPASGGEPEGDAPGAEPAPHAASGSGQRP